MYVKDLGAAVEVGGYYAITGIMTAAERNGECVRWLQPRTSDDIQVMAEPDSDGDGFPDAVDNCPSLANPGQEDGDGDGIGDAYDPNP